MTSNLLKATRLLLDGTSRDTWPDLAKQVGCTYSWLCALDNGKIDEPGINKIERLYCILSGKTVEL